MYYYMAHKKGHRRKGFMKVAKGFKSAGTVLKKAGRVASTGGKVLTVAGAASGNPLLLGAGATLTKAGAAGKVSGKMTKTSGKAIGARARGNKRKAAQRGVKVALVGAEEIIKRTNPLEKK